MSKREWGKRCEKKYSKRNRNKKILFKETLDKKESRIIKNEIADYLKRSSNGHHKKEMPIDQESLKTIRVLPREPETQKKDAKNPPWFFFITWRWLKKNLWWLN